MISYQKLIHLLAPLNNLYYLFDAKGGVLTMSVDSNTKFYIRRNTPDKYTVWETWKLKSYSKDDYQISKSDIIVDIGSNIGSFAIWAAKRANEGLVIAYEPDPQNFVYLKKNIALNNCKNIRPSDKAISSKSGEITIYSKKSSNNVNTSIFPDKYATPIKVKTISLSDLFNENKLKKVDLLKIDAEGAEYSILLNTPRATLKKIDRIYCEYHDYFEHGHSIKDLIKYLKKVGYRVELTNTKFNLKHWFLKMGYLKAYRNTAKEY